MVKNVPEMQEMKVSSLGREDTLEKEMETHSSILACEIPWTEAFGRLQSMASQRVGHNVTTKQQQHSVCTLLYSILKNKPKLFESTY